MSGSSDSGDQHRRPGKNGKDQEQDRAIRDLRAEWVDFRQEDREWKRDFKAEDDATHEGIVKVAYDIRDGVKDLRRDWGWARYIAIAFATTVISYAVYNEARVSRVERESRDHIKEGMQIGRDLQREVGELRDDLNYLRRGNRTNNHRE